jgi:hypothetical protein
MIDDEVRDALRELVEATGALSARIVEHDDMRTGVPARTLALGSGEYLRVELPTRSEREHDGVLSEGAAFDRVIRQLRAIRRRWEATRLPEVTVTAGTPLPSSGRVIERITTFLQALGGIDRASNAFLVLRGKLITSARAPDDLEGSRWPFLARRVVTANAPHSSHGEIIDPDAYAMSFWYEAAIVVLLTEPYAIDFVRHRCRQVARELANLLPLLEPDPTAPAMLRRRPPTGPT